MPFIYPHLTLILFHDLSLMQNSSTDKGDPRFRSLTHTLANLFVHCLKKKKYIYRYLQLSSLDAPSTSRFVALITRAHEMLLHHVRSFCVLEGEPPYDPISSFFVRVLFLYCFSFSQIDFCRVTVTNLRLI